MAQYKVNSGIEYLGKRAEVGAVVSDLPPKAIKWLRESGAISPVDGDATEEPEAEEPAASIEEEIPTEEA
jgi:hypothetical protein